MTRQRKSTLEQAVSWLMQKAILHMYVYVCCTCYRNSRVTSWTLITITATAEYKGASTILSFLNLKFFLQYTYKLLGRVENSFFNENSYAFLRAEIKKRWNIFNFSEVYLYGCCKTSIAHFCSVVVKTWIVHWLQAVKSSVQWTYHSKHKTITYYLYSQLQIVLW